MYLGFISKGTGTAAEMIQKTVAVLAQPGEVPYLYKGDLR